MVYIRKKIIKGHTYYYLVKGEKGKQKVIAYIGDEVVLRKLYRNIEKKL